MAIVNGHSELQVPPNQHLGKRKRTISPASNNEPENESRAVRQTLDNAIDVIKRNDLSARILRFPLSLGDGDDHAPKRRRTDTSDREHDNIEARISNNNYQSLDDLIKDIYDIKTTLSQQETMSNGVLDSKPSMKEQINTILKDLRSARSENAKVAQKSLASTISGDVLENLKAPIMPTSQVLSLRSQTEQGIKQLFSGLPTSADKTDADGRKVPNGFEFTSVLTVDKNCLQVKDARKFGEVFATHRNSKTLEMPRPSRTPRGNVLSFVSPFDNLTIPNKNDFNFVNLNTGSWLRYTSVDQPDGEAHFRSKHGRQENALFKAAFTTFAPSIDNTQSIVSPFDKSEEWRRKNASFASYTTRALSSTQKVPISAQEITDEISDEDLEEMVNNFIPDDDDQTESDKLLNEISELIETLTSYQSIRDLEVARGPSSASKPSKDERETFDMLRDELRLLVSSLPPYAVAKLNGDQLEDLNISSKILTYSPEFVGTAQADDHTLRRTRAAQSATPAATRSAAPTQNRTTYSTPASAYNAQARAYNSIPNTAYTARPSTTMMYSTPRPTASVQTPAYAHSGYRSSVPAIHTPSIQQFQRQTINGYGSAAGPNLQPVYNQRPPQSGYQQRMQDNTIHNRSDGSLKPNVNGEASHHQRQYVAPGSNDTADSLTTAGQSFAVLDAAKPRRTSGTPQPQTGAEEGVAG